MNASALFFSREGLPPLRGLVTPCGSLWFVAIDALAGVGCSNVRAALRRISHQERRQIGSANVLGLHPHTQLVTERGLSQIVQNSQGRDSDAGRWVFLHVLPTAAGLHSGAREGAKQ